jgi:hypothetical protein
VEPLGDPSHSRSLSGLSVESVNLLVDAAAHVAETICWTDESVTVQIEQIAREDFDSIDPLKVVSKSLSNFRVLIA